MSLLNLLTLISFMQSFLPAQTKSTNKSLGHLRTNEQSYRFKMEMVMEFLQSPSPSNLWSPSEALVEDREAVSRLRD